VNDLTSGSDSREARTLDDPVMGFELDREIALLREEPGYAQFGRSSKTLGKSRHFRLVATAARAGTSATRTPKRPWRSRCSMGP
jgi:hypothetical protein